VPGFPILMDGGTVTAPYVRILSPTGEWIAEKKGLPPGVEVELDPNSVSEGHDPQLERGVSIALEKLKENPPAVPHQPRTPTINARRPVARRSVDAARSESLTRVLRCGWRRKGPYHLCPKLFAIE
jgi:C-terminal processing protease CtpA/Prc